MLWSMLNKIEINRFWEEYILSGRQGPAGIARPTGHFSRTPPFGPNDVTNHRDKHEEL